MSACTAIIAAAGALISPSFTDEGRALVVENLTERPAFVGNSDERFVATAGKNQSLLVFGEVRELNAIANVRAVISATSADLVLVDAGYNNNLRPGMVCVVEQQGKAIATFVIAESTAERAVGPILTLAPEASIQPGDIARIKTVHFN